MIRPSIRLAAAGVVLASCTEQATAPPLAAPLGETTATVRIHRPGEPVLPLTAPPASDPVRVRLGGRLFHDRRLSADGSIACATCHQIENGGDDGRVRSPGVGGRLGSINTPTVLNSGGNFVHFWNGRSPTLEDQAGGPLTAPVEMAATWDHALTVIRSDPDYVRDFQAAYADGVTEANVRKSIATFERTLVTTESPFDRWLLGDDAALSETQLAGYQLFKSVGCVACHQGQNLGGNMFQRFGVVGNYMEDRGDLTEADLGRYAVTEDPADKFVFKVPTLRNIAMTAPYLHDGSAATLNDAVQIMSRYQLGRPLTDEEVERIVAFLESLTGVIPDVTSYHAWTNSRRPESKK